MLKIILTGYLKYILIISLKLSFKDSIVQADNSFGKLKFTIVEIDQL
jgi:hypothetical protein